MKRHYSIKTPWVTTLLLLALLAGIVASLGRNSRDFILGQLVRSDTPRLETFARQELAKLASELAASEHLLRQKWPEDSRQPAEFNAQEKPRLDRALADARVLLAGQAPSGRISLSSGLASPALERALLLDTLRRGSSEIARLLAEPSNTPLFDRLPSAAREAARNAENQRINALPPPLITPQKITLLHICGVLGALGAGLQGLWSIAVYLGNRRFRGSWMLFYLLRPIAGGGLAIVFCFLIEGGFVQVQAAPADSGAPGIPLPAPSSLYAFGAISLVVGLFIGEAMEKLRKIAAALFSANEYSDNLADKSPTVERSSVSPAVENNIAVWQVHLEGRNLAGVRHLFLNGKKFDVAHGGDGGLLVSIPAEAIGTARSVRATLVRLDEPAAVSPAFELKFPKRNPLPPPRPAEVVPVGGA